jgi:hypothetical protein
MEWRSAFGQAVARNRAREEVSTTVALRRDGAFGAAQTLLAVRHAPHGQQERVVTESVN